MSMESSKQNLIKFITEVGDEVCKNLPDRSFKVTQYLQVM